MFSKQLTVAFTCILFLFCSSKIHPLCLLFWSILILKLVHDHRQIHTFVRRLTAYKCFVVLDVLNTRLFYKLEVVKAFKGFGLLFCIFFLWFRFPQKTWCLSFYNCFRLLFLFQRLIGLLGSFVIYISFFFRGYICLIVIL